MWNVDASSTTGHWGGIGTLDSLRVTGTETARCFFRGLLPFSHLFVSDAHAEPNKAQYELQERCGRRAVALRSTEARMDNGSPTNVIGSPESDIEPGSSVMRRTRPRGRVKRKSTEPISRMKRPRRWCGGDVYNPV
jgi:hypothetical protein